MDNKRKCCGVAVSCCCISIVVGVVLVLVLLVFAAAAAAAVICGQNEPSYASVLINDGPGGDIFTLDNLSTLPSPDLYAQLREELFDTWTHDSSGYTYGYAHTHDAPMILYNGTKIPGLFENVPSILRGVFWMKGNGIPEILATLQEGQWFPEEKILLMPNSPFSWSWWGGGEYNPKGAFAGGVAYSAVEAKGLAESQGEGNITVAVSFKTCPEGVYCQAGSQLLDYAHIQSHSGGNLNEASVMTSHVEWKMELMDDEPRGAQWYRRIAIICDTVPFGSYYLTKIIDQDGYKIEPYYSEYVAFMEGYPQIIWTGFGPNHHLV